MKIRFTKHALRKFKFFKEIGWNFRKSDIKGVLTNFDYKETDLERKVEIVLKKIDSEHYLRVICTKKNDIITVVTFYPTSKKRYLR